MSELRLQIRSPDALRQQWNRSLKHGALMGAIEPVPTVGATVRVTIVPGWGGPSVVIEGTVLQATAAASVVQLDGLSEEAAEALKVLGISEAVARPSAEESAPAAEEPVPAAEESALAAEEPASREVEVSAEENSEAPGEEVPPPPPQGAFAPPPQGAFAPPPQGGAFAPPPQGAFAPVSQGAAAAAVAPPAGAATKVESSKSVDLSDPRQITAAAGAGTPAAVALLPAPSHEGDFGPSG